MTGYRDLSANLEAAASAALVERVIKGDKTAETEMVKRYQEGVLQLLKRLSGDPDKAHDLIQDTWQLVLQKVRGGELKDHQRLAAYIVAIARNQFLMSCRKAQNSKTSDEIPEDLGADDAQQPYSQLLQQRESRRVRQMLAQLPNERDREVLSRFYFDDEDKQSISESLALKDRHLDRVLFRARSRLKALWEKKWGQNGNLG